MADASPFTGQPYAEPSPEEQKKVGQSPAGPMGDEHANFVQTIAKMISSGEINVFQIESFFHPGAYEALKESDRSQVDLAMINIADMLRHIADYYASKQTPNASPQLEQMIESLWQMKDRLEQKYGDILKF